MAARSGRRVAASTRAFQNTPAQPRARLLIVGDSTGVGVGAERPQASLAGLIGQAHPEVAIDNRCRNGARIADLPLQFGDLAVQHDAPHDVALVLAGGNDVLRLTPLDDVGPAVDRVLRELRPLARRIVWMGSANVGGSPLWLRPLAWYAERRSFQVARRIAAVADRHGVPFLDFCQPRALDVFSRDVARYFASDGVHPSSASYRHCFEVLQGRVPLGQWLRASGEIQSPAATQQV